MFKCIKCGEPISDDRLEGLAVLNVPPEEMTCLICAPNDFIKAIYSGESGSSPLIFADFVSDKDGIKREN